MLAKRSKSVLKKTRQAKRRHLRNKPKKTELRTALKYFRRAKTKATAMKRYLEVQSIIDKAAQDKIIHKNAAARLKSRIMHHIKKLR
jgi:small subunit ribosomal protein S20